MAQMTETFLMRSLGLQQASLGSFTWQLRVPRANTEACKASWGISSDLVQYHFCQRISQGNPEVKKKTLLLDGRSYYVALLGYRYKKGKSLWHFFSVSQEVCNPCQCMQFSPCVWATSRQMFQATIENVGLWETRCYDCVGVTEKHWKWGFWVSWAGKSAVDEELFTKTVVAFAFVKSIYMGFSIPAIE